MLTSGDMYRHYKSTGGTDHVYEVIGIAKHSENNEILVIYKPFYPVRWQEGCDFSARPLAMWEELVEWEGKQVPRFTLFPEQPQTTN